MKVYLAFFFIVLFILVSCEVNQELQVIQIPSVKEKREFNTAYSSKWVHYIQDVEEEGNIQQSLIKKINLQTDSVEAVLNTGAEVLKYTVIEEEGQEQFVWLSTEDEQQLVLNLFKNGDWLVVDLEELSSVTKSFDFETSDIVLFENSVYFDLCEGINRYLASVDLIDERVQLKSLESGIDCSFYVAGNQRKIFFSFLKPRQEIQDVNSVFVQYYNIDSGKVSDPTLVHASGENPAFSPQFILTDAKPLTLFWEKSYGSVFNSKSLYFSEFNDEEEEWSDAKRVYDTDNTILDFHLTDDDSDLIVLIHEYNISNKEQFLVEFNVSTDRKTVLHRFDEKIISFGQSDDSYFLLLHLE